MTSASENGRNGRPPICYDNEAFATSADDEPKNVTDEFQTIDLSDSRERVLLNGSTSPKTRRLGNREITSFRDDSNEGRATYSSSSGSVALEAGSPVGEPPPGEDSSKEADAEVALCGWSLLRPRWLQRFRTAKWALFWLCWAGALQGMVVNGFVNVGITTIEKRFGLRSSQTGLVAGGYDVASFLCLVPVTYLGGRAAASKPRWVGWGTLLMGLGSLLFAVPHFIVGPFRASGDVISVCHHQNDTNPQTECELDTQHLIGEAMSVSYFLWVFLASQLLHGAGASPLFTLGVTYIDENVSKKMSSVYLGIYYTMSVIGPAMGYVIGGQFLEIYSDFLTVDPSEIGLTPSSNVWIGAWWIGFILSAILCTIVAIPLLAFPPSLPGSEELRKEKVSEAHGGNAGNTEGFGKIRELPKAFVTLMKNPTFFFLNLAGASEGLLISGFAAFLPKLIENQFSVSASLAALLMGVVTVPAGGGGTFLGGYLVKKMNLNCSGIIKLCVYATLVGVGFSLCFFITCPNFAFAGVTHAYGASADNDTLDYGSINLDAPCNEGCSCTHAIYDPVCGSDGVMYYSPCYAGCTAEIVSQDFKLYGQCACINASKKSLTSNDSPDYVFPDNGLNATTNFYNIFGQAEKLTAPPTNYLKMNSSTLHYEAINQMCESDCQFIWLFIVLTFGIMFFTFLATMPALSATLRCVQDDQRSFALGIQWIKVRLLGTIPAPIIFGALIDVTCILWQTSCDGEGACLVYDNTNMSRYMLALALTGKMCSLLFFTLAWWFYKPPQLTASEPSARLSTIDLKLQNDKTNHSNGYVNNSIDAQNDNF